MTITKGKIRRLSTLSIPISSTWTWILFFTFLGGEIYAAESRGGYIISMVIALLWFIGYTLAAIAVQKSKEHQEKLNYNLGLMDAAAIVESGKEAKTILTLLK